MTSDDGKIQFLHKVDNKIHSSTIEKRTLGSSTPLFRKNSGGMMATANFSTGNKLAAVMEEKLSPIVATVSSSGVMQDTDCTGNSDSSGSTLQRVVPAIHMDAMGECFSKFRVLVSFPFFSKFSKMKIFYCILHLLYESIRYGMLLSPSNIPSRRPR